MLWYLPANNDDGDDAKMKMSCE